jgi:hypothetical protein
MTELPGRPIPEIKIHACFMPVLSASRLGKESAVYHCLGHVPTVPRLSYDSSTERCRVIAHDIRLPWAEYFTIAQVSPVSHPTIRPLLNTMDDDTNPTCVDVDDIDDVCSCDSVYHSLIDTQGGAQPPVPATISTFPSPTQTAFSIPEPDSLVSKDDRSYQRARQRLKKPDDISKAKRCVRCKFCRPWKSAGNEGRPKQGRGLRASLADAEGKGKLEKSIELTEDDHDQVAPVNRNVSLADLVKAPRKGSGMLI